ncbi:Hypoxanthine-guanine phosphoribosyltransferase [Chlamydiales bacterium SCGC AG-110-M15]|nr:Hypoxanthine-guanine phosphoribosyltransferase [Chlamydiales bacterium SCGC AG-110-M15]
MAIINLLASIALTGTPATEEEVQMITSTTQEVIRPVDELRLVISQEEIYDRIAEVSKLIDAEYRGKDVTLIMIMKGSICLAADLMRTLETDVALEHITCSSYGQNGTERGELTVSGLEKLDIAGKDVILIDDISDTGTTFKTVIKELEQLNPKSLSSLALLVRKNKEAPKFSPDYALFHVESDDFVIGYGLDYKEHYRGLSSIYALN